MDSTTAVRLGTVELPAQKRAWGRSMAISSKPTSGPDQLPECSSPTCAQLHDREVVYSENGAFATTSAKLGDVYPSTYRTPKSRTMLSKVVAGFRRTMLQRESLNRFLSARRGNSARIAPCLSCGIRSRPAPRTSAVIPEWVITTSGSL